MTKQRLYTSLFRWAKILLSSLMISAAIVPHVSAHLMVAQRGTINFKNDGAFMVLSIPVSAFENIDDDGDGKMSATEFSKHKPAILDKVRDNISLSSNQGIKPLQGLLLSPVVPHDASKAPAGQLIVMGRFALDSMDTNKNTKGLTFHSGLFGKEMKEKTMTITSTRSPSNKGETQKHKFELTLDHSSRQLFTEI